MSRCSARLLLGFSIATLACATPPSPATTPASTTSTPPRAAYARPMCLSPSVHGPHIGTVGHMEIYKSADNRSFNREDYLIEHIGPAHPSELDALGGPGSAKAALAKLWERGLNGLASHGCSKPGVPPFCHSVSLQTHTITVQELAAEFERIYDFKDACVVILVTLVGLTAPRCAPGDAGCGPIRFELPANECRPHDPSAPRTTVSLTEPHYPPYEEGACEHDGDCFLNGCGQYCHSWTTPGFGSTCEGSVSCAFCGCVAGRCRWFTEPSPANAP